MMKIKYTKGPWVWNDRRTELVGAKGITVLQDGEGLWDLCSYVATVVDKPKQAEADARLIAAAPELLEALQQAVGSLEWAASVIGDIPPKCDYMERIEEAKAIIAKATGGAL